VNEEAQASVPGAEPTGHAPASLVQVLFKGHRVEFYANPEQIGLRRWDPVIVEVERGCDLGQIYWAGGRDTRRKKEADLRRVLRLATPEEVRRLDELRASDPEALAMVKERVQHFDLPMHLVDAEHQFDGHRVTFYFTADHRIDFRELVRDLASIFRTRIELRQISTREAARRLGGVAACGRQLCCECVLCSLERVSLQSARDQKLSMSPTRLSGVCGRLLCCLNFEVDEGEPCPDAPCGWLDEGPAETAEEADEPAAE
jgi:cell fate regulator YaaT (PSP1 superfamily)